MIENKQNIVSDAFEVIRAGGFKSSTFAYFAFSVVYAAMLAYIPILLNQEFGLPANIITALFFGYYTAAAFIRLFVYRLDNALGTYITMVLGMINITLFLYILSSTNIFLLLILALLAMGLSHGIVFPSGAITVMRSVPQSNLILANSVYLLAFDMGGFVDPLNSFCYRLRLQHTSSIILDLHIPFGSFRIHYIYFKICKQRTLY